MKRNKYGFTLVEIVSVIAILGILATIAVPSVVGYFRTGRRVERANIARTLFVAAQSRLTELRITGGLYDLNPGYYDKTKDINGKEYIEAKDDVTFNVYGLLGAGSMPSTEDLNNEKLVRYLSKSKGVTASSDPVISLLDPVVTDKSILENAILIEYNVMTGVVLSVFYSDAADVTTLGYSANGVDGNEMVDGARPGYEHAQARGQGYYGVGYTGDDPDNPTPTVINIKDGFVTPLRNIGTDSTTYQNVLYAEILMHKDVYESGTFKLGVIDGGLTNIATEAAYISGSIDLTSVSETSLTAALASSSTHAIYKTTNTNDGEPIATGYSRFVWVIDYVGGNMADGNLKHSIGVKYNTIAAIGPCSINTFITGDKVSARSVSVANSLVGDVITAPSGLFGTSSTTHYLVSSPRHLFNVRYKLNGNFIQMNDIDLSFPTEPSVQIYTTTGIVNFLPIGVSPKGDPIDPIEPFTGHYTAMYGDETRPMLHKITGLTIDSEKATVPFDDMGLFGINKGIIQGLILENTIINGSANKRIGAFAGQNVGDAQIISCFTRGTANDSGSKVEVTNTKLSGGSNSTIGGIAGINEGKIEKSATLMTTFWGATSATGITMGGIAGINRATSSETQIKSSYVNFSMKDDAGKQMSPFLYENAIIGGLVGSNENGKITRCYTTALVPTGKNPTIGAGTLTDATTIYYLSGTDYNDTAGPGKPVSIDDLKGLAVALGTDFETSAATELLTIEANGVNLCKDKAYPYPKLKSYMHYGDWPEDIVSGSVALLYYERYSNNSSLNYNETIWGYSVYSVKPTDRPADTLVYNDGYCLEFPYAKEYVLTIGEDGPKQAKFTLADTIDKKDEPAWLIKAKSTLPDDVESFNNKPIMFYDKDEKQNKFRLYMDNKTLEALSYLDVKDPADIKKPGTIPIVLTNADETVTLLSVSFNPLFSPFNDNDDSPELIDIRSPRQMKNIGARPRAEYTQKLDLDFASYRYELKDTEESVNANVKDDSILTFDKSVIIGEFKGIFNGNSKKVDNVTIKATDTSTLPIGLFEQNSGTIKNMNIKTLDVTGNDYVGGMTGKNLSGSSITDITLANVKIIGQNHVGGVTGYNGDSTLSGKISSLISNIVINQDAGTVNAVAGQSYVGGIAGDNRGTILNSAVVSRSTNHIVNATVDYVGGITGNNNGGSINTCSVQTLLANPDSRNLRPTTDPVTITGEKMVGGIAGYNNADVKDVYFVSNSNNYAVKGTENVGGIVGQNKNPDVDTNASITNAIYLAKAPLINVTVDSTTTTTIYPICGTSEGTFTNAYFLNGERYSLNMGADFINDDGASATLIYNTAANVNTTGGTSPELIGKAINSIELNNLLTNGAIQDLMSNWACKILNDNEVLASQELDVRPYLNVEPIPMPTRWPVAGPTSTAAELHLKYYEIYKQSQLYETGGTLPSMDKMVHYWSGNGSFDQLHYKDSNIVCDICGKKPDDKETVIEEGYIIEVKNPASLVNGGQTTKVYIYTKDAVFDQNNALTGAIYNDAIKIIEGAKGNKKPALDPTKVYVTVPIDLLESFYTPGSTMYQSGLGVDLIRMRIVGQNGEIFHGWLNPNFAKAIYPVQNDINGNTVLENGKPIYPKAYNPNQLSVRSPRHLDNIDNGGLERNFVQEIDLDMNIYSGSDLSPDKGGKVDTVLPTASDKEFWNKYKKMSIDIQNSGDAYFKSRDLAYTTNKVAVKPPVERDFKGSYTGKYYGRNGNREEAEYIEYISTIYNFNLTMDKDNVGIFATNSGTSEGSGIFDLTLQDNKLTSATGNVGMLVGTNSGTVDGIILAKSDPTSSTKLNTVSATSGVAGGVAGINNGTIANSFIKDGSEVKATGKATIGGLVGKNIGTVSFSGIMSANVANSGNGTGITGGVVGINAYDNGKTGTVNNIMSVNATVGGDSGYTGGVVGQNNGGTVEQVSLITNLEYATKPITATGGNVGGIVGQNVNTGITELVSKVNKVIYIAPAPMLKSDTKKIYPIVGGDVADVNVTEAYFLVGKESLVHTLDAKGQIIDAELAAKAYNYDESAVNGIPYSSYGLNKLFSEKAWEDWTVDIAITNVYKSEFYPYPYVTELGTILPKTWPVAATKADNLAYFEEYSDGLFGFYTGEGESEMNSLDNSVTKQIIRTGYGAIVPKADLYYNVEADYTIKEVTTERPESKEGIRKSAAYKTMNEDETVNFIKLTQWPAPEDEPNLYESSYLYAAKITTNGLAMSSNAEKYLYTPFSRGVYISPAVEERKYSYGRETAYDVKSTKFGIRTPKQMQNITIVKTTEVNEGKLASIANGLTFEQERDLNFDAEFNALGGVLSEPIVNGDFIGTYEGNGLKIEKIDINKSADNIGIFSQISGVVKNLDLSMVAMSGKNNVGGLTGAVNPGGLVSNVALHGSMDGQLAISGESNVGGIAGKNNGTIRDVCLDVPNPEYVPVTGTTNYGGLVGNNDGSINNALYLAKAPAGAEGSDKIYPITGCGTGTVNAYYLSGIRLVDPNIIPFNVGDALGVGEGLSTEGIANNKTILNWVQTGAWLRTDTKSYYPYPYPKGTITPQNWYEVLEKPNIKNSRLTVDNFDSRNGTINNSYAFRTDSGPLNITVPETEVLRIGDFALYVCAENLPNSKEVFVIGEIAMTSSSGLEVLSSSGLEVLTASCAAAKVNSSDLNSKVQLEISDPQFADIFADRSDYSFKLVFTLYDLLDDGITPDTTKPLTDQISVDVIVTKQSSFDASMVIPIGEFISNITNEITGPINDAIVEASGGMSSIEPPFPPDADVVDTGDDATPDTAPEETGSDPTAFIFPMYLVCRYEKQQKTRRGRKV